MKKLPNIHPGKFSGKNSTEEIERSESESLSAIHRWSVNGSHV